MKNVPQTSSEVTTTLDAAEESAAYHRYLESLDAHFQEEDSAITQLIAKKHAYLYEEMKAILEDKHSFQTSKIPDAATLKTKIATLLHFVESATQSSYRRIQSLWSIYYESGFHNLPYYEALTFESLLQLRFRLNAARLYMPEEHFGVQGIDELMA